MKEAHVEALIRFVRRVKPADLILPIGAALVSAGLQNLVDREALQRRRLAALDELVDVHRGALTAAGVSLPAELAGDDKHPLDIEGALQVVLARVPSEPEPPADKPKRRNLGMAFAGVAGVVGMAAAAIWAHSAGWLDGVAEVTEANRRVRTVRDADPSPEVPPYGSAPGEEEINELEREMAEVTAADLDEPEEAPLESCGWDGCGWMSQSGRSPMSQGTAAAVHRNKCTHRPPNARVPE